MLIRMGGGVRPTGYDSVLKGGDCVGGGAVVEAQAERAVTLSCHRAGSSWAGLRWCW